MFRQASVRTPLQHPPIMTDSTDDATTQLTEWTSRLGGHADFQARNAMRYTLPPSGESIEESSHLHLGSSTSSLAENSRSLYSPSLLSSRNPPSVIWDGPLIRETSAQVYSSSSLKRQRSGSSQSRENNNLNNKVACTESISSSQPPSLIMSGITAPSTNYTLRTNVIDPFMTQIHDNDYEHYTVDGYNPVASNHAHTPSFPCSFWFLDCTFNTTSLPEWKDHCLSHFRSNPPPLTASCPLCPFETRGTKAWDERMNHVAIVHHMQGEGLEASTADFGLYRWLWKKRLIPDALLKELEGDFEGRSRQLLSTESEGRVREARAEAPLLRRLV